MLSEADRTLNPLAPAPPPASDAKAVSTEMLWRNLQRLDQYVTTATTRAQNVLGFNTFVAMYVVLRWTDLFKPDTMSVFNARLASALLGIIALGATVSIVFAFRVLRPYHTATTARKLDRSLFFFEHIAGIPSGEEYHRAVDAYDADRVRADLAAQVHALAQSARDKYNNLRWSTRAIFYVQIPAVTMILLLRSFVWM